MEDLDKITLISKISEARHHWRRYVEITSEIGTWLERRFNITLGYRYAGVDVKPFYDEINGKKVLYCVPASKEIGNEVKNGDVCILHDGEVVMISIKTDFEGSIPIIKKEIIKLT